MRKIRQAFVAVFCAFALVWTPQARPAQAGPDEGRPARHFLWKVSSPTAEVYLYGSIHLGRPSMYPLAPVIESAFEAADVLVVEMNVENVDPAYAQALMVRKGTYQNGASLFDKLPPVTTQQLRKYLTGRGISPQQFAVYKPWLAALTLTMLQIKELGFDEEYGVDRYFLRKAKGSKTIEELESLEEQIRFLDGMEHQALFLHYTLESMEETERMLDEFIEAWKEGDTAVMEKIAVTDILQEDPRMKPVFETLLFERNVRMTTHIEDFLNSNGTYFVVVGAAHLITDQGIVALLREHGYQVEQL